MKRVWIVCVVFIVSLGVSVAFALGAGGNGGDRGSGAFVESFAVFDTPPEPHAAQPSLASGQPTQELGVDPSDAQAVTADAQAVTASDGTEMVAVTGPSGVCLGVDDQAETCVSGDTALAGDAILIQVCGEDTLAPGHVRVSGLVPDAVTSVDLATSSGSHVQVTPSSNFYTADLTAAPTKVTPVGDGAAPIVFPEQEVSPDSCS
jgi:hypothetical protein